jgi:hypothetical protein
MWTCAFVALWFGSWTTVWLAKYRFALSLGFIKVLNALIQLFFIFRSLDHCCGHCNLQSMLCFFIAWYCIAIIDRIIGEETKMFADMQFFCLFLTECIYLEHMQDTTHSTIPSLHVKALLTITHVIKKCYVVIHASVLSVRFSSLSRYFHYSIALSDINSSVVLAYTTRSCWFEKQVCYTATFFTRRFCKHWGWWYWHYPEWGNAFGENNSFCLTGLLIITFPILLYFVHFFT